MFLANSKLLVLFIIFLTFSIGYTKAPPKIDKNKSGCIENYQAPGTVKYPLGDEEIDSNILNDPSVSATTEKDFQLYSSVCTEKRSGIYADPYINCISEPPASNEILFTSNLLGSSPELNCKKCDLQVSPDAAFVLVHCYECSDVPEIKNDKNRNKREILYVVTFLEIANYTRANENF